MINDEIIKEISAPIDLLDLEKILSRHAYLFQLATEDLPEIKQNVHRLKLAMDRVYSDEFLKIKHGPTSSSIKVTDKLTEAAVQINPKYQKAQDVWIEAKRKLDDIERVVSLFQHRESAIKRLVDLYQSQYWSLSGAVKGKPAVAVDEVAQGNSAFKI